MSKQMNQKSNEDVTKITIHLNDAENKHKMLSVDIRHVLNSCGKMENYLSALER